jgi:glycosyltransferase involved in cell wall biosynthesis
VHTLHDYWLLCQRSTLVDRDDQACATRCSGCRAVSALRGWVVERHPPEVVLAVSEAVAEEHRRAGSLAARIRVLPNPVERVGSGPAPARERASGRPVVFGYLGQLLAIKGVRTLLQAFAALPPGAAELLVGGRGALEADVAAAGSGVTALGWLDDAAREDFFARIDCLVVPSEWKDPAPLVVNEAWARRLPVIGARIGGIPELVPPESRDLLFASGDAGDLRERLQRFASDPAAFAVASEPSTPGWADHVAAVAASYDDARRMAAR